MTQPKHQPSSKRANAAYGIGLLLLVATVLLLIPDMYLLVNAFLPPNPTSTSTQGFDVWRHPDTHEICVNANYALGAGLNGIFSGFQFKTRILLDGESVNQSKIRFIVIEPWDSPTFPDQDGFCLTEPLPAGKHVLQVIATRDFGDFPMFVTNFTVLPDGTIESSVLN